MALRSDAIRRLHEELENERAYAKSMQVALSSLAGGGSELFISHGDGFRVDVGVCRSKIQERFNKLHETMLRLVQELQAADRELARLVEASASTSASGPGESA